MRVSVRLKERVTGTHRRAEGVDSGWGLGERGVRSPRTSAGSSPGSPYLASCHDTRNVRVEKRTVSMNTLSVGNTSVNGIS